MGASRRFVSGCVVRFPTRPLSPAQALRSHLGSRNPLGDRRLHHLIPPTLRLSPVTRWIAQLPFLTLSRRLAKAVGRRPGGWRLEGRPAARRGANRPEGR